MSINWIETTDLSFNNLLLLERVQLSWLPGHALEVELALALKANPIVAWYLRRKCPEISAWLDKVCQAAIEDTSPAAVYEAEQRILKTINDWLVYVIDPSIYDAHTFLEWDDKELHGLIDFKGKRVLDIGAGTGRLTFVAAPAAGTVFAVEPVENLRQFIKEKATRLGLNNVYPADGLIQEIPFPDNFTDVSMGGFVFGDIPEQECDELERVTKPGGMVILCPGNVDKDNDSHETLVGRGYQWSRFEAPGDGWKRKYWKTVSGS